MNYKKKKNFKKKINHRKKYTKKPIQREHTEKPIIINPLLNRDLNGRFGVGEISLSS